MPGSETAGDPHAPVSPIPDGLRADLRAELETTRQSFHGLLGLLTPADWSAPSTNSAWTIGEVLWHIAGYLYMVPVQLELLRTGSFPDLMSIAASELNLGNEVGTRTDAHAHSFMTIAQAYDDGHEATLVALESVQHHEWKIGAQMPAMGPTFPGEYRTIETLFRYHARHFAEHAPQIAPSWSGDFPGSVPMDHHI